MYFEPHRKSATANPQVVHVNWHVSEEKKWQGGHIFWAIRKNAITTMRIKVMNRCFRLIIKKCCWMVRSAWGSIASYTINLIDYIPVRLVRSCIKREITHLLRNCSWDGWRKEPAYISSLVLIIRVTNVSELMKSTNYYIFLAVNIKNDSIIIMKVSCWVCAPSISHS
jgi:hypothetical protein